MLKLDFDPSLKIERKFTNKKQKQQMEFGLWSYEIIWEKQQTLIWFWKRRTRYEKLRIRNLKFEPSSATLKFEPDTNCFKEGLEDKSQN